MWWVEGVFLGFNSFLKLIIIFVNFFVRKSFFFLSCCLERSFNFKFNKKYFVFRCVCPNYADRKKRISKSYRSFRGSTRCCTTAPTPLESPPGDAFGPQPRYHGRRGLDQLRGSQSYLHSRARPLLLPSDNGEGYNNEPNHEPQGCNQQYPLLEQAPGGTGGQQERPEILLSTKQLENGYADLKSQSKPTYMEQFWICAKRYNL